MELVCKKCGSVAMNQRRGDWGPHHERVDCADCGAFVKWGFGRPWKDRVIEYLKSLDEDAAREFVKEAEQWRSNS